MFNRLSLLFVIALIVFFAGCFSPYEGGTGVFTINFGGSTSRAAYPPDIPPDYNNPGHPQVSELNFIVTFSRQNGSFVKEFNSVGDDKITGTIEIGNYIVSVKIYLLSSGTLYAQGSTSYAVKAGNNNIAVQINAFHTVWLDDGSGFIGYGELIDALDVITGNGSYTIKISANQMLAPYSFPSFSSTSDITLEADSNSVTVELSPINGSLFTVESNLTLILGSGVILKGRMDNDSPLIKVNSGGQLIMNYGSIITGNNNTSANGGAVYIYGGDFTMNDGAVISGNKAYMGSGAVSVGFNGTFTMEGGVISGNKAYSGGGVTVGDGYNGSFIMKNNAVISGNAAEYDGGGLVIQNGTFTIEGGTISGNIAGERGGGIYLSNAATFVMEGGIITGNTAGAYGGGVHVTSPSIGGNTTFIIQSPAVNSDINGNTDSDNVTPNVYLGEHNGQLNYTTNPTIGLIGW